MWMNDKPIGVYATGDKFFIDYFLNQICRKEYNCFKDLLKYIFVKGKIIININLDPEKRIKIDSLIKKLKKIKRHTK